MEGLIARVTILIPLIWGILVAIVSDTMSGVVSKLAPFFNIEKYWYK